MEKSKLERHKKDLQEIAADILICYSQLVAAIAEVREEKETTLTYAGDSKYDT